MTLRITTFNIMTLSTTINVTSSISIKMLYSALTTLSINNTHHKRHPASCVIILSFTMLNVVRPNVKRLNVVSLNVVAPFWLHEEY
jgi:hypothetical protein